MKIKKIKIPEIPEEEQTPVVKLLFEIIYQQQEIIEQQNEKIQALEDEVAILKKTNPKPKVKPSQMNKKKKKRKGKRPGSKKKNKTAELEIHETIIIPPENVPEGSDFKGYVDFTTQGIRIKVHNILYRREHWVTPDGKHIYGQLLDEVTSHYDSELTRYILYQYHHCLVTSPLLLEQLHEWGISLSKGQLNNILVAGNEVFHSEKDDILLAGLEMSSYIQVDDTGARHQGKNGVCTHIGNDLFAWFASTESKSRINFLNLLRAGRTDYIIDVDGVSYMAAQKLPKKQLELIKNHELKVFANKDEWEKHLQELGIVNTRHIRIITEGAMIGSLLTHGFNPEMTILSDDAGQFNIFYHALCWIHAERTIRKIIPFNDNHRLDLENSRKKIWDFYDDLKDYKDKPGKKKKKELEDRFDEIFQEQTCFMTLNLALKRLHKNKKELLLVLARPEIPLHNNGSESDIREYVKRRKVSGSTRSDLGRKSRDTFISLKKTARKLGISFWEYLKDRISKTNHVPHLSDLIRQRALGNSP